MTIFRCKNCEQTFHDGSPPLCSNCSMTEFMVMAGAKISKEVNAPKYKEKRKKKSLREMRADAVASHPDRPGGSKEEFQKMWAIYDEARNKRIP